MVTKPRRLGALMTSEPTTPLRDFLPPHRAAAIDEGAYPPMFASFFMAGFEASSHRRKDRHRLDLIAATRHDVFALQDYRLCRAAGMNAIRDGLRWHLIERYRGLYDWSSWLPMLRAAREMGVQVIWDLFHYGRPDFIEIGAPGFIDAFAQFAAAAARVHRDEIDEPPIFCPFNEISFFAWAVDDGYFPPVKVQKSELKAELVRIALAAVDAVRSVDRRARFIWAEPLIHVAPRHHGALELRRAEDYRLAQYQAYDMLTGRMRPELGGDPDCVDVVGLNFYPHNQWYYRGPTIPMGHHEYRSLATMLLEAHSRYGKPMLISETGAEGSGRPAWLHYVCDEVRQASALGAPIRGVCIYPVTAYLGWDNERHCDVGLFSNADDNGRREIYTPLLDELNRQLEAGVTAEQEALSRVQGEADYMELRFGPDALSVIEARLAAERGGRLPQASVTEAVRQKLLRRAARHVAPLGPNSET